MAVRSRKVKEAQEAEAAGQAAQAKSKGSLPVGVPCQGYLPHQATRDPASIVEISQVWPCSLWCYLWLYPRWVPSLLGSSIREIQFTNCFTHGNKPENKD